MASMISVKISLHQKYLGPEHGRSFPINLNKNKSRVRYAFRRQAFTSDKIHRNEYGT